MLRARLAETILAMTAPPDRAAAAVGDLLEDEQDSLFFWSAVARTASSMLWRELRSAHIRLVGFALLGWFVLLSFTGAGLFIGDLVVRIGWAMLYLMDNHTGLELLTEWRNIDIPLRAPDIATKWGGFLMGAAWLPFWAGIRFARAFPGRELVSWIAMMLAWPLFLVFAEGPGGLIPVTMQVCALLGAFTARWTAVRPA
jgi:hypothetical protein